VEEQREHAHGLADGADLGRGVEASGDVTHMIARPAHLVRRARGIEERSDEGQAGEAAAQPMPSGAGHRVPCWHAAGGMTATRRRTAAGQRPATAKLPFCLF
jgi:hypothetical protein